MVENGICVFGVRLNSDFFNRICHNRTSTVCGSRGCTPGSAQVSGPLLDGKAPRPMRPPAR